MNGSGSGAGGLGGRAALATGASSGSGWAIVVALARRGADIALVSRSEEDLQEVKGQVSKTGRRALVLPTDLASATETRLAVERTVEHFGRVDVLVNAASTDAPGPVEDLDVEGWDRALAVNLRTPFLLSGSVFPHMRRAGHDSQRLFGGGQEGMGQSLRLLRLDIRPDGSHGGHGRRGKTLRHPGMRALPWRDGDQLGRMVAGGAEEKWPRGGATHGGTAPEGGRIVHRVAVCRPAGVRADQGDNHPDRREPALTASARSITA